MSKISFSRPPKTEYSFYLSGFRRLFNKDFPFQKEPSMYENPRFASIDEAIEAAKKQAEVIHQEEKAKGNDVGIQGDVTICAFFEDQPRTLFMLAFASDDCLFYKQVA